MGITVKDKHIFALYVDNLSTIISENTFLVSNEQIIHRCIHVLRLQRDDEIILFDRSEHASVRIVLIGKKVMQGALINRFCNVIFKPNIKLLLPVLKKDALSDAIYNAVETGVSEIYLVTTQKSQRVISAVELDRLERVAISAAEQSKNFALPQIHHPMHLDAALALFKGIPSAFFDPHGKSVQEIITFLSTGQYANIVLLIGPEGDLTAAEKSMLEEHKWLLCALTPTVLRSVQAVSVSIGIMRSFLSR